MGDAWPATRRVGVVLCLAAVGLIETQNLAHTLGAQGRRRQAASARAEAALVIVRPELDRNLEPGTARGLGALTTALNVSGAAEAELFTFDRRRLVAWPSPAPVDHWPSSRDLDRLKSGALLSFGSVSGSQARLLTYTRFREGLLRLATVAPDLVDEQRERRDMLVGHTVALSMILLAATLVLLPMRGLAPAATPRVLDAYVEAVERLRDHREALSQQHEAERQRLQEEVHDKEAMARAGELTAGMAHEVRNGLATILGYARLLEQAPSSAEAASQAALIREECQTLEGVVRRFMEFVKRETLNIAPFDVGRMLARVVAREGRHVPEAAVALEGAPTDPTLVGDEEMLERAFENLVRNACEAAGAGGRVWITTSGDASLLSVKIADDGPGLPAEKHEVRPFFTTKSGGLGLGLPIALKIVRLHGGDLVFGDRSPRGLEITVRLPRRGPPTAALPVVTW